MHDRRFKHQDQITPYRNDGVCVRVCVEINVKVKEMDRASKQMSKMNGTKVKNKVGSNVNEF